jgi:sugar/nucleoside kinase (ribokinase family)
VTIHRLLFAGEAIVDVLMRVPALPDRGGDLLASASAVRVGGGFNVMAAAARQGLRVVYAGGHGTGLFGDLVRSALAAEGVDVHRPPDPDADTGFDVALVEPDGERTFVTSLGAETHPGSWERVAARPGDVVYVSGYGLVPADAGLAAWAAALPPDVLLFTDPGPLVADIPAATRDAVMGRCDWWSCNLREAALLTGVTDPAAAAARLLGRTGRAGVLVRAGAAGCVLATSSESPSSTTVATSDPPNPSAPSAPMVTVVPAPAVEVVDTTGAGDAHAGVFIAALAAGLAPAEAARRANAAAAIAITRAGPATAPGVAELDEFLQSWPARWPRQARDRP